MIDNHNNDDEDPLVGPNQGKQTKRKRTKESESSKKPSTTKETPKGKAPLKDQKLKKLNITPPQQTFPEIEFKELYTPSHKPLGVITPPQQTFPKIEFKELYTPSHKPLGVIYEDLANKKSACGVDELYKFSDGTLKKVRDELHHRVLDFDLGYNKEMLRRKWTTIDKKRSELMVELIDK
ncbi:hypothetical protein Tco_0605927 [Tanacetum coccineum]